MNMSRLAVVAVTIALSGCAHVTPQATSTSFSPEAMEIVGPAKGESSQTKALCLIPMNNDAASVITATEAALLSVNAEALINTSVDEESGIGILGLWCWQTIRVHGTAVRFKPQALAARTRKTDPLEDQTIEGMKKRVMRR